MFTGIVEKMGTIRRNDGERLSIEVRGLPGLKLGDSLAVNGVCLTVGAKKGAALSFDVSPETLERTNLGELQKGDRVNLERPARPNSFLGGHWVSGHVDAVGRIEFKKPRGEDFVRLRISAPRALSRYFAVKGSVTVDGTSLTITATPRSGFETVLVPHTLEKTTLGRKGKGDSVNLEIDLIARYLKRLLEEKE